MSTVVNQPAYVVLSLYDASGVAVTGKVNTDFTKSAYLVSTPATTATPTVTEIGGGDYALSFTPTAVGLWNAKATIVVNGDTVPLSGTVQVVTAAQSDPAASITTLYGAELANLDAAVSSRATPANVTALQAALAAGGVTLVSPVSVDGARLTLYQGDSYAAAQSRQLSWTLTGQPDLSTATITLTIVSGTTLTKTAASVTNPASGSPTIAFVLTVAETAAFTAAKVGTFDLSATIGSDEITLARGRVYVEADV